MSSTWLGRIRQVHFVGIGGIGMSGIAELLLNLGYRVTGSDVRMTDITERLASMGAGISVGHDGSHVGAADVVVTSSAVSFENPEVLVSRARHIPVIPRAEMLAGLMRLRVGIAIAGAHGKTTTTSMVALVLERAGLDPTAVIGGRLSAFGSNARLGRGQYMVVEADESDRSFLKLSPAIAVVTNIDREHLEAYGSFDRLIDAFRDFAEAVPFYGTVVACIDDEPVRALAGQLTRRTLTYGFSEDADIRATDATSDGRTSTCEVEYRVRGADDEAGSGRIALQVPGLHNLQNALAAVAVALELGVPFDRISAALAEFRGAERRYQVVGEARGVTVIDDYGHHPTEIVAAISAARSGDPARLIVVFQPHRYTRTRDLMAEFGPALGLADVVVLTDIYAAGELPIAGVTLEALAGEVRLCAPMLHVIASLDEVPAAVGAIARSGDVVLSLGAGSIAAVPKKILAALDGAGGTR
jgi:UDP-N-acetylmuramate--alanine ligase